uniref:Uncharacterized protein n=1 Tax=Triticum urartu TaxID=4572 RepID=A0A8R7TZ96_TRIUA
MVIFHLTPKGTLLVLIARMGDGCPHGSGVSDLGIHKEERRQLRTRPLVLLILLGWTCCLFHVGYMTAMDDHRDLHGDAEALHMVELHGTTVPRCGAAKLGHISASGTLHADVLCLIILTTIVVGVFYMLFISWPTSMFANHPSASCYMIPT